MEIGKHCIWGLLEIKNMKGIFSRQISDSPPPEGAPELISGLTRLRVYLFLPFFFPFFFHLSFSNQPHFTPQNKQNAPLRTVKC